MAQHTVQAERNLPSWQKMHNPQNSGANHALKAMQCRAMQSSCSRRQSVQEMQYRHFQGPPHNLWQCQDFWQQPAVQRWHWDPNDGVAVAAAVDSSAPHPAFTRQLTRQLSSSKLRSSLTNRGIDWEEYG